MTMALVAVVTSSPWKDCGNNRGYLRKSILCAEISDVQVELKANPVGSA